MIHKQTSSKPQARPITEISDVISKYIWRRYLILWNYIHTYFTTFRAQWWLTISSFFDKSCATKNNWSIDPRYFETYTRKVSRVGSSWKVTLCQSQGAPFINQYWDLKGMGGNVIAIVFCSDVHKNHRKHKKHQTTDGNSGWWTTKTSRSCVPVFYPQEDHAEVSWRQMQILLSCKTRH